RSTTDRTGSPAWDCWRLPAEGFMSGRRLGWPSKARRPPRTLRRSSRGRPTANCTSRTSLFMRCSGSATNSRGRMQMRLHQGIAARGFSVILVLMYSMAAAQTYPTRPVKIVVPATTGGAIDLIARSLAEKMSAPLGQPVIVENKPGAANNLGTDFVAKSPPDGYTLVIVASSHATNKWLYKNLPYDPVKDFEPVAYTHVVPLLLAVHPSVGARNVQALAA